MGVAISLRKDKKTSFYKEMLLGLMSTTDANEIVLCTGFLQYRPNAYNVFEDEDSNNHVFQDFILKYKKATIVGIKGESAKPAKNNIPAQPADPWYNEYLAASDYLKSEKKKRNSPVDLQFYYHKSGHWHAKIAILMRRELSGKVTPVAAIAGSSNLTRPAFGDDSTPNGKGPGYSTYNLEADTLIYVSDVSGLVEQQLASLSSIEYGAVMSFSNLTNIYGNKSINSEADVIKAEYDDIMQSIKMKNTEFVKV